MFAKATKCGWKMVPAKAAALRLMPHAEAHVPVSADVKALLPIAKDGPDEGGIIELSDLFMGMFNGQMLTPKPFPLQQLRSGCLNSAPYFKLIGLPTKFYHASFPNSFNKGLTKHVLSDIYNLRQMLNQMLGYAAVLIADQGEGTYTFNATSVLLIGPAATGVKMLTGFISRLRAIIVPRSVPDHLRKPLVDAPIQSNDIWDVPQSVLSPVLEHLVINKSSGQFFRGRGRAARGSSNASSGSSYQQPGRGRGGRGRGGRGYNNNNRRNRNRGPKKPAAAEKKE